jgi:hypothetical protein
VILMTENGRRLRPRCDINRAKNKTQLIAWAYRRELRFDKRVKVNWLECFFCIIQFAEGFMALGRNKRNWLSNPGARVTFCNSITMI